MNLLIPKESRRSRFDRLWGLIKPTWVAPYVTHKAQVLAGLGILEMFRGKDLGLGRLFAKGLFDRPMLGAGYGWESRQALVPTPSGTSPVVTTGANALDFTCKDFVSVLEIGFIWEVAGTVTALVMDFDKFSGPNAAGTVTDKLDGTNGVITAPSIVASQAIGSVVHKDLGDTLSIDLDKGNSIRAIVTTTTTAGSGVPYILVVPRAETNANLAATIGFASS